MPQRSVVLSKCNVIDPGNIETYLKRDGFKALAIAREMTPQAVIDTVKASKLLGRGGAGFPT